MSFEIVFGKLDGCEFVFHRPVKHPLYFLGVAVGKSVLNRVVQFASLPYLILESQPGRIVDVARSKDLVPEVGGATKVSNCGCHYLRGNTQSDMSIGSAVIEL